MERAFLFSPRSAAVFAVLSTILSESTWSNPLAIVYDAGGGSPSGNVLDLIVFTILAIIGILYWAGNIVFEGKGKPATFWCVVGGLGGLMFTPGKTFFTIFGIFLLLLCALVHVMYSAEAARKQRSTRESDFGVTEDALGHTNTNQPVVGSAIKKISNSNALIALLAVLMFLGIVTFYGNLWTVAPSANHAVQPAKNAVQVPQTTRKEAARDISLPSISTPRQIPPSVQRIKEKTAQERTAGGGQTNTARCPEGWAANINNPSHCVYAGGASEGAKITGPCRFKSIMTNQDYVNCGRTPP
ncbi:hypothetical protein [Parahaliea mediterranea]|uniref:hypothetical protein n=1 Tax=Parahaliea mediterranea TaxID=651086 RepID=UPI0013006E96|nr:hypothetical protein [Parahaliea mediterranea]